MVQAITFLDEKLQPVQSVRSGQHLVLRRPILPRRRSRRGAWAGRAPTGAARRRSEPRSPAGRRRQVPAAAWPAGRKRPGAPRGAVASPASPGCREGSVATKTAAAATTAASHSPRRPTPRSRRAEGRVAARPPGPANGGEETARRTGAARPPGPANGGAGDGAHGGRGRSQDRLGCARGGASHGRAVFGEPPLPRTSADGA